jgi:hypothetical protein
MIMANDDGRDAEQDQLLRVKPSTMTLLLP